MTIENLEEGYRVVRFSAEDMKSLPKVNLMVSKTLPDEIVKKLKKSQAKFAAQRGDRVAESPEPAVQSR